MKIISNRKAEVTIKRPNGTTETVVHPHVDFFTPQLFDQMKKAMRDAGKGEPLNYRNIDAVVEMEESDYHTTCNRCHVALDIRTAHHQKEWMRAGSLKARVETYYCNSCWHLLGQIGAGEYTELDERAHTMPSYEPQGKEDY